MNRFTTGICPLMASNRNRTTLSQRPRRFVWIGLGAALILCWLADLFLGSVRIPFRDVVRALIGTETLPNNWSVIIRDYRLPKSIAAMFSGAALSVVGLQMQTLFRNSLADPFILGISSGANLGAALVILVGASGSFQFLGKFGAVGNLNLITAASLGAFAVFLLTLTISRRVHATTLLISGVLVSYIVNAFVRVLVQYASPDSVQAYLSWTFGSFTSVTRERLTVFLPVVSLALALSALTIKPLNALLLGELHARSVGIDPGRSRRLIILVASILTGTVTAYCGIIGFIGIAVPHLCRSLFADSDHLVLMPGCILVGACTALIADMISQVFGGAFLLPLNSVTALIGGPVILFVILKKRNLSREFGA